jgi:glycosyltransferase involved in cell wall biosynthesis
VNILIATDVFPPKSGGSGWSTFHLARALAQRGHRIEIVLPKQNIRQTQTRVYEGLNVVQVGYNASNLPALRAWQRTRALEKTLSAYLAQRAREFDLIHAQHLLSIAAATAAKKIFPIPVVGTVRDYWAVCLYGTLWRDDAICPICHGGEMTKCLAQKYGGAAKFMQPAIPFVERELRRRQRALQNSDAVIAVSHFVASTLRGIVDEKKMCVVPNLIDVDETNASISNLQSLDAARDRSPSSNSPYLMFVGKLNALKGADWLPAILEKSGVALPLIVAGDGELRGDLARCKQIEMRGWLSNAETLALLKNALALVFPARWAEPLARTLLEAQALGVPIVALNTGGTRDIIDNNFNGLLAENINEFSAQVRRVADDAALCARLSENAKRVAQEKFSASVVASELEKIYADVVVRRPSSAVRLS